jgi:glycosyltransferase involved in cell wall biosynthesis
MKVTFIGTLPPIKALSPYCYHLASALSKKVDLEFINFNHLLPEFLYSGGTKAEEEIIYTIKNVQTKSILSWYNPISWVRAGLDAKGNIIHVQHWAFYANVMYCLILPVGKLRGKKIVLSIHNITPHVNDVAILFIDKILNKILFSFTDAYIVHNQRNKEKLIELYEIDEQKISVITHGTLKTYHQIKAISKEKAREYLNLPMDKKIVLLFGYIWGYKGLDILLESFTLIKKSVKDIVLFIAGQPLKDWGKYEKMIKENDLEDFVIKKMQYIPDSEVEYIFSCADLVVLPYKKQPFDTHGGVGALALSFKKPLMVTDVGGLPEYVKDKRMILNPGDVEELSEKIIQVLNDDTFLKKLSKDSEELSDELSWDKIADKTIELYKYTVRNVIDV